MAGQLTDIPPGRAVFIDANIFHFYLRGPNIIQKACTSLLQRIERKEMVGYTSTLVLDELIYKLLLKKIEEKYKRNPLEILQRSPEEASAHSPDLRRAINSVMGIEGLTVLAVEARHIEESIDYIQKHSLLPRDAVHLSVINTIECTDLASADTDFDKVTNLNRWTPL